MSYESENTFPRSVRLEDIQELLELLGYERTSSRTRLPDTVAKFTWFEERDYKSYTGVWCHVFRASGRLKTYTRTPIARSYWDLEHQNRTIRLLRERLGGTFVTDAGTNRCERNEGPPPQPAEAGCHLAFERFGRNLFVVRIYLDTRAFPNNQWDAVRQMPGLERYNPRILANNLLLPFMVSNMEDYFRSAYVALLRYSPRKEAIIRSARLPGERLVAISDQHHTVESAVAETLSFQNVSALCDHFRALDSQFNFSREFHRPYRRRKRSLFESITQLVARRHELVHRAELDVTLEDDRVEQLFEDVEHAVTRCHDHIFQTYGWTKDAGWTPGLFGTDHRRTLKKQRRYTESSGVTK